MSDETKSAASIEQTPRTKCPQSIFGKARHKYRTLSLRARGMVLILLFCLLAPLLTTIIEGINSYILYSQARDGIQHVLTVQNMFIGLHGNPEAYFATDRLQSAQDEFHAAHQDFLRLRDSLDQDVVVSGLGLMLPQQISSVRALSHIGVDATDIGQQLVRAALLVAPDLREPLLLNSARPLITPRILSTVYTSIAVILPLVRDMEIQSQQLSLESLPISAHQSQQLATLLQLLPQTRATLEQVNTLLPALGWILGVNGPRTFLVQTMDRAELRPTGGFTGQFATVKIASGRVAPFTLQDIGPFEKGDTILPIVLHQRPPAPYNSWWPIDNWGIRDANLSADFPTSARLTGTLYQKEFHQHVDGVISFSLFLVSHILQVTGPITVPLYHETITAQNLEDKLHYYQDQYGNSGGIRKEKEIEHVSDDQLARKLFTRRLTTLLIEHLRKAPPAELLALVNELFYAVQTKDIQLYFTNQQVEHLVENAGLTSLIDTSTGHDGLFVVQSNISANKASKYVSTTLQDTVTLNAIGGATHILQMRFAYTQIGSVYGFDTYRDFVRVYVPPAAQFRWGTGFDQGQDHPLCGNVYGPCPDNVYNNGALLCPPGLTDAGYAQDTLTDHYYLEDHTINHIGGPTTKTSDQPGRAMYGGWVTLPKNCVMNVTLSWYVPPPTDHHPYSLLVQRQSSTQPVLELTILPTPDDCTALQTAGLHFNGVLGETDKLFSLPVTQASASTDCYPTAKT